MSFGDQEGVRFLHFPPNRSIGVLQSRDWGVSGGWQSFHEAQGTVPVPIGKEVRLKISPDAIGDLSPLSVLELDDIQWLDLSKTALHDDQLKNLQNMNLLRRLDLRDTPITDRALAHLRPLTALKELRLNNTRISDVGLAMLRELVKLENLWLYDTALTDGAMQHLKVIKSLEVLQLPAAIGRDALAELKTALPNCYINVQR